MRSLVYSLAHCVCNQLPTWTLLVVALLSCGGNVLLTRACRYEPEPDSSVQCEAIENSMCQTSVPGLQFNSTSFPNTYNHRSQADVAEFLQHTRLLLLIQLECSPYTSIFICSAVYPLCYPRLFQRVEPCRELCVAVRDSCTGPLFDRVQIQWPSALDCDRFMPYGTKICIWNETSSCTIGTSETPVTESSVSVPTAPVRTCTGRLSPVNRSQASFGGLQNCVQPCDGVYFEHDQDTLVTIWTTAVSFLTLVLSILIFFTYLLNYKTIQSLEVPIYYIVLCYGCLGLTRLIGVAVGRGDLVCDHTVQNLYNQSALVSEGLSNPACSTMFCLTYYLTLCTWSWWVVLTIEWSICTLRCGNIGRPWKMVFHLLAWGLPIPFLLAALFTGKFSGDPVMQTCWIHKHDQVGFLIVPLITAIGIVSVFVMVGFARVVNLQSKKFKNMPISTHAKDSIEPSVLVRVGNYLAVYVIPMAFLFFTYFYDYWYRLAWETSYTMCPPSAPSLQSCAAVPSSNKPSVHVYLVEVFLSLCMGFLSVFWLLRPKLFLAWRNVCCFVCVHSMKRYDLVKANSSCAGSGNSRASAPSQLQTIGIHNQTSIARESRV